MIRNKHTEHPAPEKRNRKIDQSQNNYGRPNVSSENSSELRTKYSGANENVRAQDQPTENASGESRRVTNQDDQRKITNGLQAGDVMGEEETEGDGRKAQRLNPYITIVETFGALERTSPVMEWI
jgi:hypothetical protein